MPDKLEHFPIEIQTHESHMKRLNTMVDRVNTLTDIIMSSGLPYPPPVTKELCLHFFNHFDTLTNLEVCSKCTATRPCTHKRKIDNYCVLCRGRL